MILSDRFLTAAKTFLEGAAVELPVIHLRDWAEEMDSMEVILDVEDEPEEDEDVRGQYEIRATLSLRCQPSVDEAERLEMMDLLAETLGADDDTEPDQWAFVMWVRNSVLRGIEPEELGVYEMLVGAGEWEISDEEVVGKIEFSVLAIEADLGAGNFA